VSSESLFHSLLLTPVFPTLAIHHRRSLVNRYAISKISALTALTICTQQILACLFSNPKQSSSALEPKIGISIVRYEYEENRVRSVMSQARETGILDGPVLKRVVSHLFNCQKTLVPGYLSCASSQSCRLSLLYLQTSSMCMCCRQFSHMLPTDPFFNFSAAPLVRGIVGLYHWSCLRHPPSCLGLFGIGHCMEFW
jgi:hypothetical protein